MMRWITSPAGSFRTGSRLVLVAALMGSLVVPSDADAKPRKKKGAKDEAIAAADDNEGQESAGTVGLRDKAPVIVVEAQRAISPTNTEDLPAEELPLSEDIWAWVEQMDGEIPTDEQVEAIEEMSEELSAENGVNEAVEPVILKSPSGDPLMLDLVDPKEFDIPIVVNDDVRKWVVYFTGPGRKYYERYLSRATRYRPMMYKEIEKRGLPRDLVYLSMIESGYNAHAYSSAHAAGLWQFIPGTAKLYKLRLDWWVDDRRDPHYSTLAGLEFLSELHDMFGDWWLAFAGYNGGPGRVRRATATAGSKEFFTLTKKGLLHVETANYVPKIIAAAIIGHHPERYGFTNVNYQDELKYDVVKIQGSVDLDAIAKTAGMTLADLQYLNPGLRRWATPPDGYDVRLPLGKKDAFGEAIAKLPKSERGATEEVQFVRHKVKRGDTLSTIAAKYGVSTKALMGQNRLKNGNRIYVGMTLVISSKKTGSAANPTPIVRHEEPPATNGKTAWVASASASPKPASQESHAPAPAPAKPVHHTVKSGDTLTNVANRYGVTVSQIRSWSGLKSDTIYVGQKLTVKSGSASSASVASAPEPSSKGTSKSSGSTSVKYTVRKGDSLSGIADRYKVSTKDLSSWNKIKDASSIYVGQQLTIRVAASNWKSYTVRNGDTLGEIAEKNGCTVSEIQEWNSLKGTVISPGQTLRIRG